MSKLNLRYPQDFPRYSAPQPDIPFPPALPENPTPEQKEAHDRQLQERNVLRFDKLNGLIDDIVDAHSKPPAAESQERHRPYMHPLPAVPEGVNLNRHEAQCSVCQHPQREAIEEEFLNWLSPRATADDYEIDFRAIYRHAHAFNLVAARNRRIRGVLGHILERAEHVANPTADAITRAVRAFTRVNDDGQWVEPPSHVIVSSGSRCAPPDSANDATKISSEPDPDSPNFRRRSIPRRAANLASAQLPENNHRRTTYPETHFQHSSRRKTKTKAKKSRGFERFGGSK